MMRPDGLVNVLDFGLARDLSSKSSTSIVPGGTMRYMSPKQSRGEPASPAGDAFCLRIVLYELVSGSHPFENSSIFDTLKALNEAEPRQLSSRNVFVPPLLDALIISMLAKEPGERPAMAEVAQTLESRSRARRWHMRQCRKHSTVPLRAEFISSFRRSTGVSCSG